MTCGLFFVVVGTINPDGELTGLASTTDPTQRNPCHPGHHPRAHLRKASIGLRSQGLVSRPSGDFGTKPSVVGSRCSISRAARSVAVVEVIGLHLPPLKSLGLQHPRERAGLLRKTAVDTFEPALSKVMLDAGESRVG